MHAWLVSSQPHTHLLHLLALLLETGLHIIKGCRFLILSISFVLSYCLHFAKIFTVWTPYNKSQIIIHFTFGLFQQMGWVEQKALGLLHWQCRWIDRMTASKYWQWSQYDERKICNGTKYLAAMQCWRNTFSNVPFCANAESNITHNTLPEIHSAKCVDTFLSTCLIVL